MAWSAIAFGEEMYCRAFLITRMVDFTDIGQGLTILIAGLNFGVDHFAEGLLGILNNGAFGILFG
ncbi:MAG: CPBP family intramembrane metalloprotease [Anaerolineales bacterium]|nr:CPBP family intramembrane metalloprotease [Anaerolineales bacterium]